MIIARKALPEFSGIPSIVEGAKHWPRRAGGRVGRDPLLDIVADIGQREVAVVDLVHRLAKARVCENGLNPDPDDRRAGIDRVLGELVKGDCVRADKLGAEFQQGPRGNSERH